MENNERTAKIEKPQEEKKFSKIMLKAPNGKTYELGYTRNTIRQMERRGFRLDSAEPATLVTDLFRGAFLMRKYKLDNEFIDRIWDAQSRKDDLLTALTKLYNWQLEELMADGDGENDENPTWETA